ncbi:DUF3558 domain-containing protein [Actinopolyspora lacussalsi]|nr:DUF3558 domain-containing protein [Actinopolyspora righensis]
MRRGAAVLTALVLSLMLAACSSDAVDEGDEGGASGSTRTSEVTGSQSQTEVEIANPKDAAALEPCELLPAQAAKSLGMKTRGERKPNDINPSLPDACDWETPDGGAEKISLTAFGERSIQSYYDNKSQYGHFEKLSISNYPAVVAMDSSPMETGICSVFLASKQGEVVGSVANVTYDRVGKVDPCSTAKKALKLSLPSWPAAK